MKLFDERGYDAVSLRDIADAAQTTIGNLTYHFPQKELLLETVVQGYQEDFFPDLRISENGKEGLENVVFTFFKAEKNEERAPAYYRNVGEFAKNSLALSEKNEVFRKSLYDYYHSAFSSFVESKVFRSDITNEQIETLAYSVVFFASMWIVDISPYYDKQLPSIPIGEALCNIIQPFLSEEYAKEFPSIRTKQRSLLPND